MIRPPSYLLTFTVRVDELMDLLAGGNRSHGKTPEEVAADFVSNAIEHVCHELDIIGKGVIGEDSEGDIGDLQNHLWRLGMQLRSAEHVASWIRQGKVEPELERCACGRELSRPAGMPVHCPMCPAEGGAS